MAPASSDEIGASSDETALSSDEITLSSDETAASSEYDDDDISLPSSPSPSPEPDDPLSFLDDELDTATTTAFNKKKKPFPRGRTWPNADDLALMKAVAAHHEEHGRLPSGRDLSAALRGSGIQASADQLAERVPILRSRYISDLRRLARGLVPETDADMEIYRLSKRMWGCPRTKPRRAAPVPHPERRGFEELEGMYPCLAAEVEAVEARRLGGASAGVLKRAFGRIGDETAAALEKKARKQRLAELKANAQRAELRKKAVKMLLEFIE